MSDGWDDGNCTKTDVEDGERRKSRVGLVVSLCTCVICLLVVISLMMAVLLLNDKKEVQGYDYPMYQVQYAEDDDDDVYILFF